MSKNKSGNNNTVIKRCTCEHKYQDSVYGRGLRVHNSNQKGDEYSCTVCGSVKR